MEHSYMNSRSKGRSALGKELKHAGLTVMGLPKANELIAAHRH
jgi:hypothetical protein